MGPKKLTEADKAKILTLYRQTSETTSTLAQQFGVSSSTISRFLKGILANEEYENLIQQKRLARGLKTDSQLALSFEAPTMAALKTESLVILPSVPAFSEGSPADSVLPGVPAASSPILRTRRRRRATAADSDAGLTLSATSLPSEPAPPSPEEPASPPPAPRLPKAVADIDLSAIVKDLDDDLVDEDDLEEDDEDLEDDLDEAWEETESEDDSKAFLSLEDSEIRVLPFSEAVLPPSCYLVTDRSAELVVRPLKEFAHLGKIPAEEIQQKTLPVFDNHRVARRFSNRFQKVIKIPDSRLLQKTLGHLRSKGITRIFLDGKVYQLGNS